MTALQAHQQYLTTILERQKRRRKAIDPEHAFPPQVQLSTSTSSPKPSSRVNAGESETTGSIDKDHVINYVQAEETIRNDYTAWYTASGIPGSDYILGARDHEICEEYPALRRLMDLKSKLVNAHSHPPLYIPLTSAEPNEVSIEVSPTRFDVILVTPSESWEETAALPIRTLSADPSFVFLWVGRGDEEGLEKGRECFAKWGFRRAEDIVWVKTTNGKRRKRENVDGVVAERDEAGASQEATIENDGLGRGGLLASQKEHCLMGIRGTVRRSTDTRFAHCNVDTDVLLWEDTGDQPRYPPYLYTLIESFCLGTRRLQISPSSSPNPPILRRGWVTASHHPPPTDIAHFDSNTYPGLLPEKQEGKDVLPFDPEIDTLRPKSPSRPNKRQQGGHNMGSQHVPGQLGQRNDPRGGGGGVGAQGGQAFGYRGGSGGSVGGRGRGMGPRMDGSRQSFHQPNIGGILAYPHNGIAIPFSSGPSMSPAMDTTGQFYGYGMPQTYDPQLALAYQMAQLQFQGGFVAQQEMHHGQQSGYNTMGQPRQYGSNAETVGLGGLGGAAGGYGEPQYGYSNYGGPSQGQGQWQYQ